MMNSPSQIIWSTLVWNLAIWTVILCTAYPRLFFVFAKIQWIHRVKYFDRLKLETFYIPSAVFLKAFCLNKV